MVLLKSVALDCDGPLANFCAGFLAAVEEETGHAFGPAVITTWNITDAPFFIQLAEDVGMPVGELKARVWKRVNRIGWCAHLPVVEGAQEAVEKIRKMAHHVEVVTSPRASSPTWMPERTEWLKRHFGFHEHDVHFTSRKHRFRADVLVDDKTSHLEEWHPESDAGALPVLWDAPYNRGETPGALVRVTSWDEAVEQVASLYNSLQF